MRPHAHGLKGARCAPLPATAIFSQPLRPLTAADAPVVQRLFERCAAFWELIDGAKPAPGRALEELTSIAPGKTAGDSFTFGVYEDGQLIAFVQMARDYPKASEWWIGLLVIDPAKRGRGLGAEIHRQIVAWVEAQGATALGIVVQVQNEAAYGFWRRLGYVETGRQSALILMSLPLACHSERSEESRAAGDPSLRSG